MTADAKVTFDMCGDIGLVTLDDRQRRNALSREIVRGLLGSLDAALAAGARAIVIAAQGPAFCAGANIADLLDGWMEARDPDEDPALLFKRLFDFERPVIAAVHGPALGGGLELVLSCDLVVADSSAWFAMPELGHGVIPNTAVALLSRVVGMRRALELVLTRRRVDAEEALTIGLVNRMAPVGTLQAEALQLAQGIVEDAPPGAIRAAKSNLHGHAAVDWARVLASPLDVPKGEWQEGLNAFAERRSPSYRRFWAAERDAYGAGARPVR